jgi:hypothetical protein
MHCFPEILFGSLECPFQAEVPTDLIFPDGLYLSGSGTVTGGRCYSTVTDFARFRGLSTSVPLTRAAW